VTVDDISTCRVTNSAIAEAVVLVDKATGMSKGSGRGDAVLLAVKLCNT
jgi:hypothetical protein